jgi:ABC-type bacteriocin/lantibiotic exporter with double-glycine peptidase domain
VNAAAILRLLQYAFARFPATYGAILLALMSVGVELVALSALFPLAQAAAGQGLPKENFWVKALTAAGFEPTLSSMVILFLGLLIARAATLLLSNGVLSRLWRKLIAEFASRAFETFVRTLSFSEINERSIGYFTGLAGDEAYRAGQIVISIARFVPAAVLTIIYFCALVYQSFAVAASIVVFLAIAGLSLMSATRRTHRLGGLMTDQARTLNSHFLDSLNSLRSVRALNAEAFVAARYTQLLREYARSGVKVDFTNLLARYGPVLLLLVAGLAWAVLSARASRMGSDLPFLIVVLLLLMRFFPVLGQMVDIFLKLVADLKTGQDVSHVLSRAEQWRSEQRASTASTDVGSIQSVVFQNVTFSYEPDKPVLKGLNLELVAGRSYALTGASGTGKSTLIDLLLRFYDCDPGMVKVNGIDVTNLDTATLRSKIVLVEQQSRVFNDTIFNNISFGRQASLADVEQACRMASIEKDIRALPNGYDTVLSYQGANLSGGQRQRLVLARGLLANPDMLIIDEGTNALDEETKKQVVQRLLEAYRGRLVVFVTHDPLVANEVDVVIDLAAMVGTASASSPQGDVNAICRT